MPKAQETPKVLSWWTQELKKYLGGHEADNGIKFEVSGKRPQ